MGKTESGTLTAVNYTGNLTWNTDKPGVATVEKTGPATAKVTAVGTGTTNIVVFDDGSGEEGKCAVTVTEAGSPTEPIPEGEPLEPIDFELKDGEYAVVTDAAYKDNVYIMEEYSPSDLSWDDAAECVLIANSVRLTRPNSTEVFSPENLSAGDILLIGRNADLPAGAQIKVSSIASNAGKTSISGASAELSEIFEKFEAALSVNVDDRWGEFEIVRFEEGSAAASYIRGTNGTEAIDGWDLIPKFEVDEDGVWSIVSDLKAVKLKFTNFGIKKFDVDFVDGALDARIGFDEVSLSLNSVEMWELHGSVLRTKTPLKYGFGQLSIQTTVELKLEAKIEVKKPAGELKVVWKPTFGIKTDTLSPPFEPVIDLNLTPEIINTLDYEYSPSVKGSFSVSLYLRVMVGDYYAGTIKF
jgi:hypothetical protein